MLSLERPQQIVNLFLFLNAHICVVVVVDGGGGGFFLACEDFGRMFDNSFPACAFF